MLTKNVRNEAYITINSLIGATGPAGTPAIRQVVNLTFTGAIGIIPIPVNVTFERLGNTVSLTIPQVYSGNQAAGTIASTAIPSIFTPTADRLVQSQVISSSYSGGTSVNAVQFGNMYIRASGFLEIGLGIINDQSLNSFGGSGTNGSGNGQIAGIFVYTI